MARLRISFWLNTNDDEEAELLEQIDALQAEGRFTDTIRDGLRLILDLNNNSTDILFALYPGLEDYLYGMFIDADDTEDSSDDNDIEHLRAIREKLERLEQIQLQNVAPGGFIAAAREAAREAPTGPKPLDTPTVAGPSFEDDDDDLLIISKDTSTDAGENFLKSAFSLQQSGNDPS